MLQGYTSHTLVQRPSWRLLTTRLIILQNIWANLEEMLGKEMQVLATRSLPENTTVVVCHPRPKAYKQGINDIYYQT